MQNQNDLSRLQQQPNMYAQGGYTLPTIAAAMQPAMAPQYRGRNNKKGAPARPMINPQQQYQQYQQYPQMMPPMPNVQAPILPQPNPPQNSLSNDAKRVAQLMFGSITAPAPPFYQPLFQKFYDDNFVNFFKQPPIPFLYAPFPGLDPKLYPPGSSTNGFEYLLDPNLKDYDKIYVVCYFVNPVKPEIIRIPNCKLFIEKVTIDCNLHGESYPYYVFKANNFSSANIIKPNTQTEQNIFVVNFCRKKTNDEILRSLIGNKQITVHPNYLALCCPNCHRQYDFNELFSDTFLNERPDLLCDQCKKPLMFAQLEIKSEDSQEEIKKRAMISEILYQSLPLRINHSDSHWYDDTFDDNSLINEPNEQTPFEPYACDTAKDYIDMTYNMFGI